MPTLLLLLTLTTEPHAVIYLGNNRESQILRAELTRDWSTRPSAELAIWEARRQRVMERIQLVDVSREPLHRRPETLPAIAWHHGQVEPIDRRAFNGSGCALTCVEILVHNYDADAREWELRCNQIRHEADERHIEAVMGALAINEPETWKRLTHDGELDYRYYRYFDMADVKQFERAAWFPRYVEPVIPPLLKPMPWE